MPVIDIAAFEAQMVKAYPAVPWREPLRVSVHVDDGGVDTTLACRICVAAYGMKGADAIKFPRTREEFDVHMAEKHPNRVSDA